MLLEHLAKVQVRIVTRRCSIMRCRIQRCQYQMCEVPQSELQALLMTDKLKTCNMTFP